MNTAKPPGRPPLPAGTALTHNQRQARYRASLAAHDKVLITVAVTAATHSALTTAAQAAGTALGTVLDAWAALQPFRDIQKA